VTAIVRTAEVPLSPDTAFQLFTDEINQWYGGPYAFNDPARATGIRFEPRVGGRWLELWDGTMDSGFEIGRISVWEPGKRFVTSYRNRYLPADPLTEIEVTFAAAPGGGTVVTLEHRGWERLPPEALREWAGRAWILLMRTFRRYAENAR
jgi:uncharacterized protein YndB with AHSA1/START domain